MGVAKDFVWGAATASYQIEGGAQEGGKGKSIWDVFSHEPGRIYEGHTGDVACDSYHRYKEDIAIMKELGIKAYRLSFSWPRILPEGTGKVNQEGLAYYDHVIDALLEAGIEPYVTLFHWDLPYELEKRGAWKNPSIVSAFADYAALVSEHFSDRVRNFFTINEPQCAAGLGYVTGEFAPGIKEGTASFFISWTNMLKAHGYAVRAIREHAVQPVRIGMAPCGGVYYPVTDKEEDVEAARKAMFTPSGRDLREDLWNVAVWNDPVYLGRFPEEIEKSYGQYLPLLSSKDWEVITSKLDYIGYNIYNGVPVRAGEDQSAVRVKRPEGHPRTANNWPVTPEALYWGPKFLCERYGLPLYITENGMSCTDWISLDGRVHDPQRIDFLQRYLLELRRAAQSGVPVKGYFQWSLLDNYEWASGYSERFGLVYVDYNTQKRTIKDSGYWYRDVIATNGEKLLVSGKE